MRIIRFLALVGSMVLLVATTVSLLDRRSDVSDDQVASVEQATSLIDSAIRVEVDRLRVDADLLASAITGSDLGDQPDLAEQLVRFFPGAEACVGSTSLGCTGSNLFALDTVSELAGVSQAAIDDAGSEPAAVAAVDTTSDAVLVVRRSSLGASEPTVAVRLPIDAFPPVSGLGPVGEADAEVRIVGSSSDAADAATGALSEGSERVARTTVGSPFVSGSLEITARVDASVGLAGDSTIRFAILLALGTVLMAMAAWTFLVERKQLERRATTDELTGLVNRREFERISEAAIETAQQRREGLCVMVVDLNGFKQINDTLGHQFGDLVLAAASERFVEAVRDSDVVGRWGGDEFVILLPTLDERGAVRRSAERIHDQLTRTPVVGDTTISGSIGAAIFPRHGATLDALMRAADVAMYDAKTNGVSYRIADTIETNESMFADEDQGQATMPQPHAMVPPEARPIVETEGYMGPERRAAELVGEFETAPGDTVSGS